MSGIEISIRSTSITVSIQYYICILFRTADLSTSCGDIGSTER